MQSIALYILFLFQDPAVLSQQAKQMMSEGRFGEAADTYRALLKAVPGNTGLTLNLAMALHMAERDADAIPYFKEVLKQQPSSLPALAMLGSSYLRVGKPTEALPPLRAAVKIQPSDPAIRSMLAESLYLTKDYAAAEAHLRKLPPSLDTHFLLGDSLLSLQRAREGVAELQKALKLDAKFLPVHASLGRAYMQLDKAADAVPHLEAALETDRDGSLHYQLSRAYRALGKAELAQKMLEKYKAMAP